MENNSIYKFVYDGYSRDPLLVVHNAKIVSKNFSGEKYKDNVRTFCVVLSDENFAKSLLKDKWNIKRFDQTEDNENPDYYIPVTISFNPDFKTEIKILKDSGGDELLTEESIGPLDKAHIVYADVSIRQSNWKVNGKTGIKAYLRKLHVKLASDFDEFSEFQTDYPEEN